MFKKKKVIFLFIVLIPVTYFVLTNKDIKHFISPHYLDNKDVFLDEELFSPDSSASILYYTLDIGARGLASYQSVIRNKDNSGDLMKTNLPPQLVVLGWIDNNTLSVKCNPNMALSLGGGETDLDLEKDTLERNGILIIIKERIRENRDSVFRITIPK